MRRIIITDAIRNKANEYAKELMTPKGNYKTPTQKLDDLIKQIKCPRLLTYTEQIRVNLKTIILLKPSQFDLWYNNLNQWEDLTAYTKALTKKITYNKKTKEFYKHLIDVMRYDRVQSHIMPKHINHLGIRTCVYCNAQYAVSTEKIINKQFAHYELDHFKPKSKYPFLCVSFFNLQPSCANCNKHKSAGESLFSLYTDDPAEVDVFSFGLHPASVINYVQSFNSEDLEIELKGIHENLRDNHEKLFHISKLYPRFKQEAAEILWLKKAYSPAFIKQMEEGFVNVFPNRKPNVETLYWGHDMNPDDIHKRPLNKLAQDLKKSL